MKSKQKLILKTFATLFYTLSVICICAGIVGITSTQNNSFESKKAINKNMDKTVSTKDLMTSFQKITARIEAEAKAKAEAEAKAAAEAAGYKTDYYTDETAEASNYNYMNNVRQNDPIY